VDVKAVILPGPVGLFAQLALQSEKVILQAIFEGSNARMAALFLFYFGLGCHP
jgi:hypothetical protein